MKKQIFYKSLGVLYIFLSSCINIKSSNGMLSKENRRKGFTELHVASFFSKIEDERIPTVVDENGDVLEFEIRKGVKSLLNNRSVDPNATNNEGVTALYLCCEKGKYLSVEELVKKPRVDVNLYCGSKYGTPLEIAIINNKTRCIKALLSNKNIEINKYHIKRSSPLFAACANNRISAVKLLLSQDGILPDYSGREGFTPLWKSIDTNNLSCARLLLKSAQVNPNKISKSKVKNYKSTQKANTTPVFLACEKNNLKALNLLLKYGGNPNSKNSSKFTSLYISTKKNHTKCVERLLRHPKIKINETIPGGYSPIWASCYHGNLESLKLLLYDENQNFRKDLDVNKANDNGVRPIYVASERNNTDCVNELLKHPKIEFNKSKLIRLLNLSQQKGNKKNETLDGIDSAIEDTKEFFNNFIKNNPKLLDETKTKGFQFLTGAGFAALAGGTLANIFSGGLVSIITLSSLSLINSVFSDEVEKLRGYSTDKISKVLKFSSFGYLDKSQCDNIAKSTTSALELAIQLASFKKVDSTMTKFYNTGNSLKNSLSGGFNWFYNQAKKIRKGYRTKGGDSINGTKFPAGRRGQPLKEFAEKTVRNTPQIINGRKFTGHALDQMQNRGILSPSAVLDAIKNPLRTMSGKKGATIYYADKLKVVVNKSGDIVTVITQ